MESIYQASATSPSLLLCAKQLQHLNVGIDRSSSIDNKLKELGYEDGA